MDTLPICKAKSKRSGERCKNFATKGKAVCRIHGGLSTGAKTPEGRARQQMANFKHGLYSAFEIEERRAFREELKGYKEVLNSI